MAELKLSITHFKILHTIKELNIMHLYANQDGIYKILSGTIDEETKTLQELPTFGTLISYSSKKISHYILALFRHNYITKIFDRNTNELYLKITASGEYELENFLKRHKRPYSKTQKTLKTTIVRIG